MSIRVLAVGRIQPMYREIQDEFVKRLSRYTKCELIEVADEQAPEKLSEAQKTDVQQKEWEKLCKKMDESDFLVLLDGRGKSYSSTDFAQKFDLWQQKGRVVFALGGSLGFPDGALQRADAVVSFSPMTFTHSMARVILLEQIYRGFRILNHEPYHK